jgi:nucleotide-binding universal stress UspA family protein
MNSQKLSTILVPLDGSDAADRAIPVAAGIAARSGARLHLVSVCRPLIPPTAHLAPGFAVGTPDPGSASHAALLTHLDTCVDDIEVIYAVPVTSEVIDGEDSVADELVACAARNHVDLIVMRTHGRSAIGRLCLGSVGSALIDRAGVPSLLLRDHHGTKGLRARALARILVPLDGSDESEAGIEQALALASPGVSEIRLLVVVPKGWLPDGGEEYAVPQTAQFANAEAYVKGLARRLEARGYRAKGMTLADASPAAAIARCVDAQDVDLVSIASHHRGEGNRIMFGSVIDTLVHETDVPILARRLGLAGAKVEEKVVVEACRLAAPAGSVM